jgi:hypothetical protein
VICITDNRTSAHPFLGYIIKSVAVEHHGLISHIMCLVDPQEDKYAVMETFLITKARNTVTGQTVKQQLLDGTRFTLAQRRLALDMAQQYALKMTARTGDAWVGFVEEWPVGTVNRL